MEENVSGFFHVLVFHLHAPGDCSQMQVFAQGLLERERVLDLDLKNWQLHDKKAYFD